MKTKTPQQWEMLASPGHELLAQVQAWEQKARTPLWVGAVGLVLAALVIWLLPKAAMAVRSGAGESIAALFLSDDGGSSSRTVTAPYVMPMVFTGNVPSGRFANQADVVLLSKADLESALPAFAERVKTGVPVEGCRVQSIKEPWAGDANGYINCKASADKSRLWVWGVVGVPSSAGGEYLASRLFMVVMRKTDAGVETYNATASGLRLEAIGGFKPLNVESIPRAYIEDHPEQTTTPVLPSKKGK